MARKKASRPAPPPPPATAEVAPEGHPSVSLGEDFGPATLARGLKAVTEALESIGRQTMNEPPTAAVPSPARKKKR